MLAGDKVYVRWEIEQSKAQEMRIKEGKDPETSTVFFVGSLPEEIREVLVPMDWPDPSDLGCGLIRVAGGVRSPVDLGELEAPPTVEEMHHEILEQAEFLALRDRDRAKDAKEAHEARTRETREKEGMLEFFARTMKNLVGTEIPKPMEHLAMEQAPNKWTLTVDHEDGDPKHRLIQYMVTHPRVTMHSTTRGLRCTIVCDIALPVLDE